MSKVKVIALRSFKDNGQGKRNGFTFNETYEIDERQAKIYLANGWVERGSSSDSGVDQKSDRLKELLKSNKEALIKMANELGIENPTGSKEEIAKLIETKEAETKE